MAVVCYLEEIRGGDDGVYLPVPVRCSSVKCFPYTLSISDLCQSLYETSPVRTVRHLCDREKVIVSDSVLVL